MRILIVSNRPVADQAKEKTLIKWLKQAGSGIIVNVANYAELDWSSCVHEWPHKYDGVVLGGFSKTRDAKAAAEQSAALVSVRIPLLGICGGFQDICRAYAKASGQYDGCVMTRISEQRVNKHDKLDIPTLNIGGRMKYIRKWGVIPTAIASVLEVLSLDDAGKSVAAVRHRELPMLGFQGHPEYSPNPVSAQCRTAFFEMIYKHRATQTYAVEPRVGIHQTSCDSQAVLKISMQQAHETKEVVSNREVAVRGIWQLTGSQVANVRNAPQRRGRKTVVMTQLTHGSLIEVLAFLDKDWVSIRAPAGLEGLYTRLRQGSGPRVWSQLEEPVPML
jgi:anthranilate/para-aminobenzoate synthase component II